MKVYQENKDLATCEQYPFLLASSPNLLEKVKQFDFDNYVEISDPIKITENQKALFQSRPTNVHMTCYLSKSVLLPLLEELSYVDNYVGIVHDMDTLEDGTPKKVHIHLLLHFAYAVPLSTLVRDFHTTVIRTLHGDNFFKEFNYLTHNSKNCQEEHKYIYKQDDLFSNDLDWWKERSVDNSEKVNTAYEIYKDMKNGIDVATLIKTYGFEYVKNQRNFRDLHCQEQNLWAMGKTILTRFEKVVERVLDSFPKEVKDKCEYELKRAKFEYVDSGAIYDEDFNV